MLYGLYLSAAGALAESARYEVIANNVANANTTGFKEDLAVIRARASEAAEAPLPAFATPLDAMGGGVLVEETFTRHAQGPVNITGGKFDLAIDGDGFFPVVDASGQTFFTRAGDFRRDPVGRVITADGGAVLAGVDGRPVIVPPAAEIAVAEDGLISADGVPVAQVELVGFDDVRALEKIGSNLYANLGSRAFPAGGRIVHGALEASTVSPAGQLAAMIAATRAYEANMQIIRMQDTTLGDVTAIGRVSI